MKKIDVLFLIFFYVGNIIMFSIKKLEDKHWNEIDEIFTIFFTRNL